MNQLVASNGIQTPTLVVAARERAGIRFLEFFASNIRNPNTRRAYAHAVGAFLAWCAQAGVGSITAVQPLHVEKLPQYESAIALVTPFQYGNQTLAALDRTPP
jgi:hypothetical protein